MRMCIPATLPEVGVPCDTAPHALMYYASNGVAGVLHYQLIAIYNLKALSSAAQSSKTKHLISTERNSGAAICPVISEACVVTDV